MLEQSLLLNYFGQVHFCTTKGSVSECQNFNPLTSVGTVN